MLRINGRIGGHGAEDNRCPGVGRTPHPDTIQTVSRDEPPRADHRRPEPVVSGDVLPEGDYLTWTCGLCHTVTQGGRRGLRLHMSTVHPEEDRR
jgi:hypothetical protein